MRWCVHIGMRLLYRHSLCVFQTITSFHHSLTFKAPILLVLPFFFFQIAPHNDICLFFFHQSWFWNNHPLLLCHQLFWHVKVFNVWSCVLYIHTYPQIPNQVIETPPQKKRWIYHWLYSQNHNPTHNFTLGCEICHLRFMICYFVNNL